MGARGFGLKGALPGGTERMTVARIAAGLLICGLGFTGAAQAQSGSPITVTSQDGKTTVKGELIGVEGTTYRIRTTLGDFEIDAATVTCAGEGCLVVKAPPESFTISGSAAIGAELMPALILGYAEDLRAGITSASVENGKEFRLARGTGEEIAVIGVVQDASQAPFEALASQSSAIVMSDRRITLSEVGQLIQAGSPDPRDTGHERVIAIDSVAVFVHPDNPLPSISISDLGAVFSGQIISWAELGGPDLPISLYAPDDGSAGFELFREQVLDPTGLSLAEAATRVEVESEVSESVSLDPSSIGFARPSLISGARSLPIGQDCGLVSAASPFSVKAGEYPLSRRLYLYDGLGETAPHAHRLVDFADSDAAQPAIAAAGFADRSPEYRPLIDMGPQLVNSFAVEDEFSLDLLRQMAAELGDGLRLSTTFRFGLGATQLDARSRRDAAALARRISAGDFAGREIVLAGFSDSEGGFQRNLTISAERAQTAYDVIAAALGDEASDGATIMVQAYGELLPVACNTSRQGREINRRVEVWVRPARN